MCNQGAVRRDRLLLQMVFLLVLESVVRGQCPDGQPTTPRGVCRPSSRSSASVASSNCSISVQVNKKGGGAVGDVSFSLNGGKNASWKTNSYGNLLVKGLACRRSYEIRPVDPALVFEPPVSTVNHLIGRTILSFAASPPERPEIRSIAGALPLCSPPPPPPPRELSIGGYVADVFIPTISACEKESGRPASREYRLMGALGGDSIDLELRSADGVVLTAQVLDKQDRPLTPAVVKSDAAVKTSNFILPAAEEYKVRVLGARNIAGGYELKVVRNGLTASGYDRQMQLVKLALSESWRVNFYDELNSNLLQLTMARDAQTKEAAAERLRNATEILEKLTRVSPDNAPAHETLSVLYLYHGNAPQAAAVQRELALGLNGGARFRVKLGDKTGSDRDGDKIEGKPQDCWLRIQPGRIVCESFLRENGEIFFSSSAFLVRTSDLVFRLSGTRTYIRRKDSGKTKVELKPRDQYLMPLSRNKNETDAMLALILKYVQK